MGEKIVKLIDKRKKFILFSFLRFSGIFLSFLVDVIIVRKLSVGNYGVYSLVATMVGLFLTFGFTWGSSSLLYYSGRERAESGTITKTLSSRNLLLIISLSIVTIVFFFLKENINQYIGKSLSYLIYIWAVVKAIQHYLNNYFLVVKKQVLSSILLITSKIISLSIILFIPISLENIILLGIFSDVFSLIYMVKVDKKDFTIFEFDKEYFKEILSFSLWQLFGISGLYLINYGDNLVIKYFLDIESVGIYNVGYKFFHNISLLKMIISSFFAVNISLYFASSNHKKLHDFYYKERFIILFAILIIHLLGAVFSPQLIVFIYGNEYFFSGNILRVLLIGSFFTYVNIFYVMYFNSNNKYRALQFINIGRAVLNIILDIIFINLFGLIGPAIATTIAIIITFIFQFIYCEKELLKNRKRSI